MQRLSRMMRLAADVRSKISSDRFRVSAKIYISLLNGRLHFSTFLSNNAPPNGKKIFVSAKIAVCKHPVKRKANDLSKL